MFWLFGKRLQSYIRLEVKVIIQDWRRHYNEIRPHSSLNYRTPAEFIAGLKNDLSTETRQSS
jgi:putative transposase